MALFHPNSSQLSSLLSRNKLNINNKYPSKTTKLIGILEKQTSTWQLQV